jgi:predicted nuclease of restriction endonuclease-like (RecB) superfamily
MSKPERFNRRHEMSSKKASQSTSEEVLAIVPTGYAQILEDLKSKIKASQLQAISAVNKQLISIYRDIGRTIHEQQSAAEWGSSIVEHLAKDLQKSFPGMKGFSSRNLWRMKDFYISYRDNEKLTALLAEISWTHHLIILEKCKDPLEREFYIRMSKRQSWSYRVLMNQISNQTYEKTMTSQTNFDKNLPERLRPEAKLAMKDDYAFSFLELDEEHNEHELERAILCRIEDFLREVGSVYSFMGSQYRLEVGDQEYFVDLLLYHRKLRALVAIELKIGVFIPEYVGKMQFYLAVLDDTVRLKGENPSIGIILCKEKNRTIVEYALKETSKPINVASYQMVTKLPKQLQKELPSPEQISKLLNHIT